jgi:hypothetical protein
MNARKKNAMMKAFEAFCNRIDQRYREVYLALEQDDYARAQELLAGLAQSHAKTSLSLRNFLIRSGELEDS